MSVVDAEKAPIRKYLQRAIPAISCGPTGTTAYPQRRSKGWRKLLYISFKTLIVPGAVQRLDRRCQAAFGKVRELGWIV